MKDDTVCGWRNPATHKPKEGETVIIRERFRSVKTGRFVVHYREFLYSEDCDFTFEHEEYLNDILDKYKITHWLRLPPVK